jgi:hypothetical protein
MSNRGGGRSQLWEGGSALGLRKFSALGMEREPAWSQVTGTQRWDLGSVS